MKTKLLAVMLLAGGSMFAQTRFSVGVGVGGFGGVYSQQPLPYSYVPSCPAYYTWVDGYCVEDYAYRQPFFGGYRVAPRFDVRFGTRFNDRDDRRDFTRGFEQNRNRGFDQGRNSGGQNRNQNQNGGNRNGGNGRKGR